MYVPCVNKKNIKSGKYEMYVLSTLSRPSENFGYILLNYSQFRANISCCRLYILFLFIILKSSECDFFPEISVHQYLCVDKHSIE